MKACEICGKGIRSGHTISHSHRLTKRKWHPNLQRVRAIVDGRTKRIYVCTKCIKGGKVKKAA